MIWPKCFGINHGSKQTHRDARENLGSKDVTGKIFSYNELADCYSVVKELML
jgi:hypothetical protein